MPYVKKADRPKELSPRLQALRDKINNPEELNSMVGALADNLTEVILYVEGKIDTVRSGPRRHVRRESLHRNNGT